MAARLALGQQIHAALASSDPERAAILARDAGQADLFERLSAVASEPPSPSFLHSALCAMSLPVRRPADEFAPILRQDGQYTLAITPKPVLSQVDGQRVMQSLGVPYGSLPRLILIHIMTEAVRARSRHVVLGETFTAWMRRMGFKTISYGPRGSATLIKQQLDRLLACEWMIRWDNTTAPGESEFGIKEIKLTNEYVGVDRKGGSFIREIRMTEAFFEHLREHAVPLNEHAIRHLRDSATGLDLYTWLAYRLPRINPKRPASISWQQLAVHFGNDGRNIRKFRQTVREAWERHVSGVYPEARADFDTTIVRLYASPPPLQQRPIRIAPPVVETDEKGAPPASTATQAGTQIAGLSVASQFLAALQAQLGQTQYNAWLQRATLDHKDGEWVLFVESWFKADWVRQQFTIALGKAAAVAGLDVPPAVKARI